MAASFNQKVVQGAKTRDDLLSAGIRIFAERGYHRARLDDIAAAAGTTRGALYWHFADKEDFLVALLERIIQHWNKQAVDRIPMIGDALELLASSLVQHAEEVTRVPWLNRLIVTVGLDADTISPRIAKLIRKAREPNRYLCARLIRYGQETGVFRTDIDADRAGAALAAVRTGLPTSWYIDGEPLEIRRTTEAFVESFVAGLLSDAARGRKIPLPRPQPGEIDAEIAQMLINYGLSSEIATKASRAKVRRTPGSGHRHFNRQVKADR